MTERIDLNRAWEFTRSFDDAFLHGETVPGTETAELPHTCRVTPYDYFDESVYQMICGYRRRLTVPASWEGKRIFLHIGAAAHSAEVYVDGEKLGEHRCGYTAFRTELTGKLAPGREALLVIRVDSRETQDIPPFGFVIDYMTYGGLYREVWLEAREECFIEDVFVRPAVPDAVLGGKLDVTRFQGALKSTVTLAGPLQRGLSLRQTVCPRDRAEIRCEKRFPLKGVSAETEMAVPGAALWDVEQPTLYVLRTELVRGDETLDRAETEFGFRRAEFRADGFYLNGRKLKLVGLNRHQSYPYVGYAMPASMQRLDADILKNELGLNAVRTSHYPQSPHFIRRCDELGLLVFTEIPGWQHIGGAAWQDQAVRNTEDMVRQYRNHPSIILWGVRINESPDDDALYKRTNAAARRLDPTRPTSGVRYLKKSSLLEDVYAYNDFSHDGTAPGCEKKKAVTSDPKKAYLISEYNGHMFPTKTFDSEEHRLAHALRHAAVLDAAAGESDIAGAFGWCMFDYNTHKDFGSGDRICYHGVLDMFRNKKPAADVYAVMQDREPVLSVSSSMDIGEHPAGNRGRIFAFTNADSVRFYKNDTFIREFTHADSPYKNLERAPIEIDDFIGDLLAEEEFPPAQARLVKELLNHSARFGSSRLPPKLLLKSAWLMLRYRMTFQDAYALYQKYIGNWGGAATVYRFEAVKDGQVVKTVLKGPMTRRQLKVRPSHTTLREGATYDAALIRLAMTDQNGNVLPFYQGPVHLETEGPIEIIGPDTAMLRGGLGGVFIKTTERTGTGTLTLRPAGCEPVRLMFTVEGEDERDGG